MEEYILQVTNINKTFKRKPVLRNVSLRVGKGESLGFLGPNGAGKTTLIRVILGLIRPDSGSIFINGCPLTKNFKRAISGVGSVVEIPRFYAYLNAYQNLELAKNLHPGINKAKINEVLDIVNLTDRAKDKVGTYSLGMKQRLGLARALVGNPKLVFLDEPMNGLDPQGMIETRTLIRSLQQEYGITFFITSHLLHEVEQVCDTVAIIKDGEIVKKGSLDQLLAHTYEVVDVYSPDTTAVVAMARKKDAVQHINIKKGYVTLEIDRGSSADLNRWLVDNKISVNYLVPRKTTLEQLFMELTRESEEYERAD